MLADFCHYSHFKILPVTITAKLMAFLDSYKDIYKFLWPHTKPAPFLNLSVLLFTHCQLFSQRHFASKAGMVLLINLGPASTCDAPVSPNEEKSVLFIPSLGSPKRARVSYTDGGEMEQNEIAPNLYWDGSANCFKFSNAIETKQWAQTREYVSGA